MSTRKWVLLILLPCMFGFAGTGARETLDQAFQNLYGSDMLAAVELSIEDGRRVETRSFAFGRKRRGGETRTLMFSLAGGRGAPRALLLQKPGQGDVIFVSEGTHGRVRALASGRRAWRMFGSDFAYEDFRAHSADEYRIEVLGEERIDGEPCRALRLVPLDGPYSEIVAWISTERPVFMRMDYFDEQGLWKRYQARRKKVQQRLDAWIAMEDEMLDLRSGRRTVRRVRNVLVDAQVPDEVFTLTQLTRRRMPSF